MATTAPKGEIGSASSSGTVPLLGWRELADETEFVPELADRDRAVRVYSQMRTDPQIAGLLLGATLPIRRYRWTIDPNGARDEVVEGIAADLGLEVKGAEPTPRPRRRQRFSFDRHLKDALLGLTFGHMFFEQVGEIDDDGRWRLRKLAPRMPWTITGIDIADDGGLKAIRQMGHRGTGGLRGVEIPVSRLVAYVWDMEGANWSGRSMIRACFRPWLVKDRLVRVDAVKHERNGIGTPWIEAAPGSSPKEVERLHEIARSFRAGDTSGGAGPAGSKLRLVGTEGTLPDTLASIRYCDQAMSRSVLMMFMDLGTTDTGSRALGDTFVDFFALGQETIAGWAADVFCEHVIEDWVDWNHGVDEQAPLLAYERQEEPELAVADLVSMVDKGIVTVDEDLETAMRQRYQLPERSSTTRPAPAAAPPSASARRAAHRHRHGAELATGDIGNATVPERPLRRQLYPHEIAAAADFDAIEATHTSALERLLAAWAEVQAAQIDDLVDQIAATDDLATLADLATEPLGAQVLGDEMEAVLEQGAGTAVAEAVAQGAQVAGPDLVGARAALRQRAEAIDTLLARSIAQAAANRAAALTGGGLAPGEVADQVREHLEGLSDAYLRDQLGAALVQAQNSGRRVVYRESPPERIYASELLDDATCDRCRAIDGAEYGSLEEAEADYPTGGYRDCRGGPRCRGTLVAVFDETPAEGS